jgi:hypothetical protein
VVDPVTKEGPSNRDMLHWFSEDERHPCDACGRRAVVSLPDALAAFCLNCGAVTIDGVRIDVDRSIDLAKLA